MSNKDGGPAFPLSVHPEHGYGPSVSVEDGMTLRQYYAAKALHGLLSNPNLINAKVMVEIAERTLGGKHFVLASHCLADAMIAHDQKESE